MSHEFAVTPVALLSPGRAMLEDGPADLTRPGEVPVLDRHSRVTAVAGHSIPSSPQVQDAVLTMVQLAVVDARQLPPVLPDTPQVIGYATCPDAYNYPSRTFIIIKDGPAYHLDFVKLGPLMSQAEMRRGAWNDAPEGGSFLRYWWWSFGRFFFQDYFSTPGLARNVELEIELARARFQITQLRRELGYVVEGEDLPVDGDGDMFDPVTTIEEL